MIEAERIDNFLLLTTLDESGIEIDGRVKRRIEIPEKGRAAVHAEGNRE